MTVIRLIDSVTEFIQEVPRDAQKIYEWSFNLFNTIELYVVYNEGPKNTYILPHPLQNIRMNGVYYIKSAHNNGINLIEMIESLDNNVSYL
jgi:hypothetical protein